MKVITHQYRESGIEKRISLCRNHSNKFHVVEYMGIYHGLHKGNCQYCDDEIK